MTATMKQAERIAEAIFDRIEKDRTLIKTNVVTEIYNDLLLTKAIEADGEKRDSDIDQNAEIIRKATRLMNVCLQDAKIWLLLTNDARFAIEALHNVLRKAGHM